MIAYNLTFNGLTCPMNFDPQKHFIGVMDFFSILLPGLSSPIC